MKRPNPRFLLAVALAAAVASWRPGPVVADTTAPPGTGIIVGGGTVQPVGDPHGRYTFVDVEFKPASPLESIQAGDSFTVTSTLPLIPFYQGTNGQPPDWSASYGDPVGGTPTVPPEYESVTWTYFGTDPISAASPLDPAPGPYFQVDSPDLLPGLFQYTFQDTLSGAPNVGHGTFSIAPEPSSLALVGLAAPAAALLLRRSRRAAA